MADQEDNRGPWHGYVPVELASSEPLGNSPLEGERLTEVESELIWSFRAWARVTLLPALEKADARIVGYKRSEIITAFARDLARASGLAVMYVERVSPAQLNALFTELFGGPTDPKDVN